MGLIVPSPRNNQQNVHPPRSTFVFSNIDTSNLASRIPNPTSTSVGQGTISTDSQGVHLQNFQNIQNMLKNYQVNNSSMVAQDSRFLMDPRAALSAQNQPSPRLSMNLPQHMQPTVSALTSGNRPNLSVNTMDSVSTSKAITVPPSQSLLLPLHRDNSSGLSIPSIPAQLRYTIPSPSNSHQSSSIPNQGLSAQGLSGQGMPGIIPMPAPSSALGPRMAPVIRARPSTQPALSMPVPGQKMEIVNAHVVQMFNAEGIAELDVVIGSIPPFAEVVRSHPQEMLVYQEGNPGDREAAIQNLKRAIWSRFKGPMPTPFPSIRGEGAAGPASSPTNLSSAGVSASLSATIALANSKQFTNNSSPSNMASSASSHLSGNPPISVVQSFRPRPGGPLITTAGSASPGQTGSIGSSSAGTSNQQYANMMGLSNNLGGISSNINRTSIPTGLLQQPNRLQYQTSALGRASNVNSSGTVSARPVSVGSQQKGLPGFPGFGTRPGTAFNSISIQGLATKDPPLGGPIPGRVLGRPHPSSDKKSSGGAVGKQLGGGAPGVSSASKSASGDALVPKGGKEDNGVGRWGNQHSMGITDAKPIVKARGGGVKRKVILASPDGTLSSTAAAIDTGPPVTLPPSKRKKVRVWGKGIEAWKTACLESSTKVVSLGQIAKKNSYSDNRHLLPTLEEAARVLGLVTEEEEEQPDMKQVLAFLQQQRGGGSTEGGVTGGSAATQSKGAATKGVVGSAKGGSKGARAEEEDVAVLSSRSRGGRAKKEKEEEQDWVQCDSCTKWRKLPSRKDPLHPGTLPDKWICSMNSWAPVQASCSAAEETTTSTAGVPACAMKIRVWVRRLRAAERFETLRTSPGIREYVRHLEDREPGEVDWIRCCNPNCGKWRACLRSMNGRAVRHKHPLWYCWMNFWDDPRASCSAPQEKAFSSLALGTEAALSDDEEDDEEEERDDEDGGGRGGMDDDGVAIPLGVSSRGRVVRSRFHSRRRR